MIRFPSQVGQPARRSLAKEGLLFLLLALAALSVSCAAPRRAIIVPSVYPVAQKVATATSHISQAKAAAVQVKLSLAQSRPADAAASLDTLTTHLLAAESELAATPPLLADLQKQNEQLATAANTNADLFVIEKAHSQKAAHWRNRLGLLALGLLLWMFRGPIFGLLKMALRLCGVPIPFGL